MIKCGGKKNIGEGVKAKGYEGGAIYRGAETPEKQEDISDNYITDAGSTLSGGYLPGYKSTPENHRMRTAYYDWVHKN